MLFVFSLIQAEIKLRMKYVSASQCSENAVRYLMQLGIISNVALNNIMSSNHGKLLIAMCCCLGECFKLCRWRGQPCALGQEEV